MSDTYGTQAGRHAERQEVSGWAAGWLAFAAIMMIVQGVWWLMAGIIALFNNQFFVVGQQYVFQFDITTWGWIHLVTGIVVLLAGIGLFSGAMWARVVGVIVAAIAALIAFAWMPWYPIWGLLLIGISVAVIWAITAHGSSLAEV